MKLKHIINGFWAFSFCLAGCVDPDDLVRTESEITDQLIITGRFAGNENTEYETVIDRANGTAVVQTPYYISDTEPIQGDITRMRLKATLPVGARFDPPLSGIHNLKEGFSSTLIEADGSKKNYTFTAIYKKSERANIIKVELANVRAQIVVADPVEEGKKGQIIIYKTSSSIDGELQNALITIAPWATIESDAYDPVTKILDLSVMPTVTIIAQDGVKKTVYETVYKTPEFVEYGVGYVAGLFGFQTLKENSHGFEVGANRTMAVVDDYLILSNSNNFVNMPVFNRYNGKLLDQVKVNVIGIPSNRIIRAITSDDNGHMVAMAYVSTRAGSYATPYTDVNVWVWKNGIENTPTLILDKPFSDPVFDQAPMGVNWNYNIDMGSSIHITGDITSGKAVLTTTSPFSYRMVFISFVDGIMSGKAHVEFANVSGARVEDYTKILTTNTEKPFSYISTPANETNMVICAPVGDSADRAFAFTVPDSHYWGWQGFTKGIDYVDFNGARLLAVQNGSGSFNGAQRLYVADITKNPNANSMSDGFIFDSQQGNTIGNADVPGGVPGSGYTATGYTSPWAFDGVSSVLGENIPCTGDVIFAKSQDGLAVQVYMLTTDHGLIAFELTKFKGL